MRQYAALILLLAGGCSGAAAIASPDGGDPGKGDRPPTSFPKGSEDAGTRKPFPIVLAHGLDGFKNIGPLEYYYGVPEALTQDGHDVFVAQVDAYNSSEVRGAQLQTFVQSVLQQTGAEKVNLICHSQGSLDCRYVASNLGPHVGAVVAIAGPNRGDVVADVATQALPGPAQDAVGALLSLFGGFIDGGADNQDAKAAIQALSSAGADAFTVAHPDDPRVAYYSVAGRSNGARGDQDCGTATPVPFISRYDSYVSTLNPLLAAPAGIINGSFSPAPTNDGLVTVASAKWGTFLGCLPADHLSEIGQIGGQAPDPGNPFDHVLFYRQLANWLVERGY
ncbi:MAG TPA: triacylglycerol lipase [Polyangia bacterium]|nr:triacylglycerol lipase [Polyangia bacterium]